MQVKDLQLKRATRSVLLILLLCLAGMTKAQTENIIFADDNVKAICVANWDTDSDGELNQTEAAAVTSLDGVFMFDDEITTFNELSFFTGLTAIGEDEFNSCTSLTAVSIPNAVTSIGNYAFSDCSSLTSITSYACTPPTLGSNVFDNVPSALVVNVPCHTSAMYQVAEGWSDFSNYVEFEYGLCPIPFVDDNVKAICVAHWDTNGDGELSYAEAAAVTNLGTHFKSTAITSFDELEYFTSLTSIPNTAFYGCTSLASIALPFSVLALGNGSFYNCTNLATMTVYAETPSIVGTNAFKNVPTDMAVYVPCGTYDAYHNANGWSQFANMQEPGLCPIDFADANVKALCVANWDTNGDGELSYDEAAAVTDLGRVFENKSNITSFDELQYFTGLSSIGYHAFYGCQNLISLIIPASVTSIGNYALSYCSSLEQIIVDNENAVYDSRENCNAIIKTSTNELVTGCKNTIIPNSVISIGNSAFYSCHGLTLIDIPNSVNSIGNYAFRYCSGLVSIEIPNSVTFIGNMAFDGCSSLTIIEIPNSVISIGSYAFYYCSGLTSISFGNSVTSIGSYAFSNCSHIVSMTVLANNPPDLGSNAFYNVNLGIPVYVPCGSVETYSIINWGNFNNYVGLCAGEITATTNPIEGGIVTGTGFYEGGVTCTLTATANTGYSFINWKKNGVRVSNSETYSFVVTGDASYEANFVEGDIIAFADSNVKALCVANWDTDGDGELSYVEAASVTDLGQVFNNDTTLTSFDELQYFSGLTSISNQAFYGCSGLISIEIPNSVNSIGSSAFRNCIGLTSIEIPNTVTSISNYAFSGCSGLTMIEIPSSVTIINSDAFSGCSGLTSIVLPNSITRIYDYAFSGCSSLTSIEIPISVNYIGINPFVRCSGLEQVIVNSGNTVYDSRGNCNAIIKTSTNELVTGCKNTVIPNNVTSIGMYAFNGCSGLTSIEIPNSVTSIGSNAFWDCTGLTGNLIIGNSVTTIGEWAFSGCSSFTGDLTIGNSVTTIGRYAFSSCTGFVNLTIGNSVSAIGDGAFSHCSGLTSIVSLAETPPVLALGNNNVYYVFSNVHTTIPVYVPCGTVEGYQTSNCWSSFTNIMGLCSGVVNVIVNPTEGGMVTGGGYYTGGDTCVLTATPNPSFVFVNWTENGVVSIDSVYSFYAHPTTIIANFVPAVGNIVFADANVKALCVANWDTDDDGELSYVEAAAVTDLGQVFKNNSNIISFDELQYFMGLTSIGSLVFFECGNLTSIEIPNSVTSIGNSAFSYCQSLTSVEIPNSVTSIGNYAFEYCNGLTSIEIPNSVTSMGHNPFAGCNGLEQITVDSGNTIYDSRENCNAVIKTSTNVLVSGCKSTIIPNSVTTIGNYSFSDCYSLTSIEIPNFVTTIGDYAFEYCSGLTSMIVLADNPPVLGNNVFYIVNKSIPVYVPCESVETYTIANWGGFNNFVGLCAGEISVIANPSEGGTAAGGGYYDGGAMFTLTATANTGYAFVNWTKDGNVVSNSEIYNFYVAGDATFVANFIAIPPVPVIAEYYPDPDEPNSPYVKVHWAASSFEALIGDETSSSYTAYMPFYTLYNYSISEALYTADELAEAGLTTTPMTSLSWEAIEVTTNQTQNNISIWMANVPDTELTTTSHLASNMTLVYTGNIGIPPLGWNEFVFNENNFTWDGTSNVLILCQRNNGQWNGQVKWRSHNPGFYGMAYKYQDYTPYDAATQTYALTCSNTSRPNIIMKAVEPTAYNLYRANCDYTGAQLIAENLSNTEYIDETWWQLENDSYKYGVSMADSTNTEIFWSNCVEKQGNVAVQTCILSQGWNWFSTYLDITLDDLETALVEALPGTTINIKSQTQNVKYQNGRWAGQLTALDLTRMYMISVEDNCQISLEGLPINPSGLTATINNGANWLAFPYSESMTVTNFFGSFPMSNDQVKSQSQNARYQGGRWGGQLNTLVPGKGYIYISNSPGTRTFTFPISTR